MSKVNTEHKDMLFINMQNKKYDNEGRLIYDFVPEIDTLYTYSYQDGSRIVKITNEKNRSNHTTLIEQTADVNGGYRDVLKTEEGDIYIIRTLYNKEGKQLKYEQVNKKKKTSFIKTFYYAENSETHIFIINYDGKKDFGFKADVKKLMGKS